jgi:1-acyl-sn-glycerol-3-phosphate acyltransferase
MKRFVFVLLGVYAWMLFRVINRLRGEGRENLSGLPSSNVLFVSNHLTYYMDVLGIHSAIASARCTPLDGFRHNLEIGFVAAVETLNERGVLPRIFKFAGAVLIRRSWRDGDRDLQRPVDPRDVERVTEALRRGWLITFPTGTTTAGAPVRKGTAHIIRESMPIVVPVHVEGFDCAFSRKGFRCIGRGVDLVVRFGAPLSIAPEDSVDRIVEILTSAMPSPAVEAGDARAA